MCVGKAGCAKCALAEIFKNAKRGLFLFSSLSVVSVVVQLQCWSSRVSPVVKSVCKTICLLLLVIVNVSVVFFACAPTFWGFAFGRDFQQKIPSERQSPNLRKSVERERSPRLTQNPCYLLAVFSGLCFILSTSFFK